jgi:hypothetical protein
LNGKCALCRKDAELIESHIIPKFVIKWLKDTSLSAVRTNIEPNKRVQDGLKKYLPCANCEGLFSTWEKQFCEQIFLPVHNNPEINKPLEYKSWALKFAVLVSWRVLEYYYQENRLLNFTDLQKQACQKALETWSNFLLGKEPHPGQYEQHLLPVNVIKNSSSSRISPFINRYLQRSIAFDVIRAGGSIVVFTKMGHLMLFGCVQHAHHHIWKGTKMHLNKGKIFPAGDFVVPGFLLTYFNNKADENAKLMDSVSPKQQEVIRKAFMDNIEGMADSDVFKALEYDVNLSGEEAFKVNKSLDVKHKEE